MPTSVEDNAREEIAALLGNNPSAPTTTGATKFDTDKPRYDLIHPEFLEGLAWLMALGAKKYGARNCEKGTEWGRWHRAALSHLQAWWRGERYDQTDGQHHLLSAAWNIMLLYTHEIRGIGTDDRHPMHASSEEMAMFWRNPERKTAASAVQREATSIAITDMREVFGIALKKLAEIEAKEQSEN